jgi:hypothetical protein
VLEENDMDILFTCPLARAAWFAKPWYIRSDLLIQNSDFLASTIMSFANSDHPYATLSNIFTFMWCLWKARNDTLFQRKVASPFQVFFAAQAITNSFSLEVGTAEPGRSNTENHRMSPQEKEHFIQGNYNR